MECRNCENMADSCAVETLYSVGLLKACPYINEPVLNDYGHVMNPVFTEKYQLSEGHVLLSPIQEDRRWKFKWIITKKGSGSCGASKPDNYVMAYKKSFNEILEHYRLNELDKTEIKEILDNKFDTRRTFIKFENNQQIEEIPEEIKEEYISPFDNIDHGEIGEQLELF